MFTITVTPRFGDVDGFRHINNTKLPEWFELGRMPIYLLFQPELDFEHWNLVMARICVDFHIPMVLGHEVQIRTYIARLGTSSMSIYQEAWQQRQLCASGESVLVHYDFAAGKSLPVPDNIRAELMQHARPEGATAD